MNLGHKISANFPGKTDLTEATTKIVADQVWARPAGQEYSKWPSHCDKMVEC
jgi:hypothetical protein